MVYFRFNYRKLHAGDGSDDEEESHSDRTERTDLSYSPASSTRSLLSGASGTYQISEMFDDFLTDTDRNAYCLSLNMSLFCLKWWFYYFL